MIAPSCALLALAPQLAEHHPEPLRDLGKADEVRLVYFVPSDRKPARRYERRIEVLMSFVADLYRDSLASRRVEADGLDFEFDGRELVVHLVRGRREAEAYAGEGNAQWDRIVPEVEAALGPAARSLYVIFAETYSEGPAEFEFPGGVALGARYSARGGVGLFSAWILREEFCAETIEEQVELLLDETPIVGRKALGAPTRDSPRFEFIEDGFGAVVHELGHALGLPHDQRRDHEFVMGNGFRRLRENHRRAAGAAPVVGFSPENARFLACTRFLGRAPDLDDTTPPAVSVSAAFGDAARRSLALAGEVADDGRLGALLVVDARGGAVLAGLPLEGAARTLDETLELPAALDAGAEVEILVSDHGGNVARQRIGVGAAAGRVRGSALVFLVEGLSAEVLERREARALRALRDEGRWTAGAWLPWPGLRAAGWADLMTGVGPAKHRVEEEWTRANEGAHPAFLERVERFDRATFTASLVDWPAIHGALLTNADVDAHLAHSSGGSAPWPARLEELLEHPGPLCVVVGTSELLADAKGGKPSRKAVAALDEAVGAALERVRARPAFADESWLLAVACPYAPPPDERGRGPRAPPAAPLLLAGGRAGTGELRGTVNQSDVAAIVLEHLGVAGGPDALDALALPAPGTVALGVNLVRNGDAETGRGHAEPPLEAALAAGWSAGPGFAALRYETSDFITADTPVPDERGEAFFMATAVEEAVTEQVVDLAELADVLGAGRVRYRLEAWIGGYREQRDEGTVTLSFLDERGKELASAVLGPLTPQMRRSVASSQGVAGTAFLPFHEEGAVPRKTRLLRVRMQARRVEGGHNDVYVDGVSVVLRDGS